VYAAKKDHSILNNDRTRNATFCRNSLVTCSPVWSLSPTGRNAEVYYNDHIMVINPLCLFSGSGRPIHKIHISMNEATTKFLPRWVTGIRGLTLIGVYLSRSSCQWDSPVESFRNDKFQAVCCNQIKYVQSMPYMLVLPHDWQAIVHNVLLVYLCHGVTDIRMLAYLAHLQASAPACWPCAVRLILTY